MAGGLRYEAGRDLPLGMQELLAKHYLGQKATQILTQENAVLMAVLPQIDFDCQFCAHTWHDAPCADMAADEAAAMAGCEGCTHTECGCHTCRNNSNYQWCGAEEALNRLAQIQEDETEGRE